MMVNWGPMVVAMLKYDLWLIHWLRVDDKDRSTLVGDNTNGKLVINDG